MKKIYAGIVVFLLLGISVFAFSSIKKSGESTTFEFIYASLEGYTVEECRFYYPPGNFVQRFKAKSDQDLLKAKTKPFKMYKGSNLIALNCTNIARMNESIVYEYEIIDRTK
jgi:hypothetical protein